MTTGRMTSIFRAIVLFLSLSKGTTTKTYSRKRNVQKYCALSKLHDLEGIKTMISPRCTNIYGLSGIENAMQGMESFFSKFNDVFWIFEEFPEDSVQNNDYEGQNPVEIRLQRYWTDISSNLIYKCFASEIIDFDDEGLITTIFYTIPPSTPIQCQNYPAQREDDLRAAADFLRISS